MQYDEWPAADSLFRRVYAIRQSIRDSIGLGYVLNNLASVASQAGQMQEAIHLIEQSTEIRAKTGDRQGMAVNYCNIGEAYMAAGQYAEAQVYFSKSLAVAMEVNYLDLWQYDLEMLARCEQKNGHYAEALQWLSQSNVLKDSLYNINRSRQLTEMQTKYETARKEKDLIREQLRVRDRTFWLLLALASLALGTGLSYVLFKRQRDKQAQLQREAVLQEEIFQVEMRSNLQDERLRISRDLHDNLGAELTLIGSELSRQVQRSNEPSQQKALENIVVNARTAMQQLRETIWAIHQHEAPLRELLTKISEFSGKNSQIDIGIHCPPELEDLTLSPGMLLNLYRIAQEGITNAVKHAAARRLDIYFSLTDQQLQMRLHDDGQGFAADTSLAAGYGLQNMRQRALEIHGSCTIESRPGHGTTLLIRLPLRSA